MIIGVAGYIRSGKTTFAEILNADYGFARTSFREAVIEEANRRKLDITRDNLQTLGKLLLKEEGEKAWGKRVLAKLEPGKNYVVEGMRNPGDVEAFKEFFNRSFYLVGIQAPDELRYQRYLANIRDGEKPTLEQFKIIDLKDRGLLPGGQSTEIVFKMAHEYLENNTTLEDFKIKINDLVKRTQARVF